MNKITFKIALFIAGVFWAGSGFPDLRQDIRDALTEVEHRSLDGQLDDAVITSWFEVGEQHEAGVPSLAYAPLVQAMSNQWCVVLSNMTSYATSRVERVLLQNTGWFLSQDDYIGYLDVLAGKVENGEIDRDELSCFLKGSWTNHRISSVVYRRYQDVNVSNLILRIQSLGIATNWCTSVLSGHALQKYEFAIEHGIIEPL